MIPLHAGQYDVRVFAGMILGMLLVGAVLWRWRRNPWVWVWLSGAFFVSSGVQFYLWVAQLTIPIIGTGLVQTPAVSAARGAVHAVMFALFSLAAISSARRAARSPFQDMR